MHHFRKGLNEQKSVAVNVPRKKIMMCLNESYANPYHIIKESFLSKLERINLNRYFSEITKELHAKLSQYVGNSNLLFGNGADEMLYYLFTAVREDTNSFALSLSPSYFDYKSYAQAVGLNIKFIQLQKDFDFDEDLFIASAKNKNCKLVILCNPNNPTGNLFSSQKIERLLQKIQKPFLIDETYFEFSAKTFVDKLNKYPHLILIRTFSKAFSAAGLRFGYIVSSKDNISQIKKVATVFNSSILSQAFALSILEHKEEFLEINKNIIFEKKRIYLELQKISEINVYETHTNFVPFSAGDRASQLHKYLSENEISIRDIGAHPLLKNHLRVTISNKTENDLFIKVINKFYHNIKNKEKK